MGVYREQILPRFIDRACGGRSLAKWRRRLVADLSGTLVEIGSGSGLNIEHLPDSVERLLAVEPSDVARRLASRRVERSTVPVEHIGLDGASIPLGDASCDSALATFALCTIPDVETALAEVMRVLKPGGRFHVLEHGLSLDASVRRWQHRLEPMQKRLLPMAATSPETRSLWSPPPVSRSSRQLPRSMAVDRSLGCTSPKSRPESPSDQRRVAGGVLARSTSGHSCRSGRTPERRSAGGHSPSLSPPHLPRPLQYSGEQRNLNPMSRSSSIS